MWHFCVRQADSVIHLLIPYGEFLRYSWGAKGSFGVISRRRSFQPTTCMFPSLSCMVPQKDGKCFPLAFRHFGSTEIMVRWGDGSAKTRFNYNPKFNSNWLKEVYPLGLAFCFGLMDMLHMHWPLTKNENAYWTYGPFLNLIISILFKDRP